MHWFPRGPLPPPAMCAHLVVAKLLVRVMCWDERSGLGLLPLVLGARGHGLDGVGHVLVLPSLRAGAVWWRVMEAQTAARGGLHRRAAGPVQCCRCCGLTVLRSARLRVASKVTTPR